MRGDADGEGEAARDEAAAIGVPSSAVGPTPSAVTAWRLARTHEVEASRIGELGHGAAARTATRALRAT